MKKGKKQRKRTAGVSLGAAVLVLSAAAASAADSSQTQSMQLTVRKAPSYTMTIPKSQSIPFGAVDTGIGKLSVEGEVGAKQGVHVSVDTTKFTDEADAGNQFAFALRQEGNEFTGKIWNSQELKDNTSAVELTVHIPSETWGQTSPGTYRAVLTFEAELVDVQ